MVLDSGLSNTLRLKNNYFAEMCSGSEEGSYLRLVDFFVSLNARLKSNKEEKKANAPQGSWSAVYGVQYTVEGLRFRNPRGRWRLH